MKKKLQLLFNDRLVGNLSLFSERNSFFSSFVYEKEWLKNGFFLSPNIPFSGAEFFPTSGKLPDFLEDTLPDRWGTEIIRRMNVKNTENIHEKVFALLFCDDTSRMGGVRLFDTDKGEFVTKYDGASPTIVDLDVLEKTVNDIEQKFDTDEVLLQKLAEIGTSLGGARPKCNVLKDGELYIAKFTTKHDTENIELFEVVANKLAQLSGINVPYSELYTKGKKPIALFKRFDRDGETRKHYLSMQSFLGLDKDDVISYVEIAEFVKEYCVNANQNANELFKRIAFNAIISNVDDHLKNIGVMFNEALGGFELAPAFDVNIMPTKQKMFKTPITDNEFDANVDLVIDNAEAFCLKKDAAKKFVDNTIDVVNNNISDIAKKYGASKKEIDYYLGGLLKKNSRLQVRNCIF